MITDAPSVERVREPMKMFLHQVEPFPGATLQAEKRIENRNKQLK